MRNQLKRFTAVFAVAVLPFTAAAGTHIKPGLWESTSQMSFTKGGPQIPPDVLAQMQKRGMKMPDWNAPHTYKHCVSPEQAAKYDHPDFGKQKDCQMQKANWSGNTFHGEFACKQAGGTSHTVVEAVMDGDTAYAGKIHSEGSSPGMGGDYVMEGQFSGKWLGACSKDQD
jgi:hypothetical protein